MSAAPTQGRGRRARRTNSLTTSFLAASTIDALQVAPLACVQPACKWRLSLRRGKNRGRSYRSPHNPPCKKRVPGPQAEARISMGATAREDRARIKSCTSRQFFSVLLGLIIVWRDARRDARAYTLRQVNCRAHEDTKIRRAGGGCPSIGEVGGAPVAQPPRRAVAVLPPRARRAVARPRRPVRRVILAARDRAEVQQLLPTSPTHQPANPMLDIIAIFSRSCPRREP